MKHFLCLTMISFLIILNSCEGKTFDPSILDRSIKVNAQINDSHLRAANDKWRADDEIGIFMIRSSDELLTKNFMQKNEKYFTSGDGKFKPSESTNDIQFPEDGSKVDFIAYYPFTTKINSKSELQIDITDQDNQEAIDLLYSNNATELSRLSGNVNMVFDHKLSKLDISIKTKDNSPLQNTRVSLKGFNTKANFSIIDGSFNSITKSNIRMKGNSIGDTFEALVIPTEDIENTILEIINGRFVYTYKLKNASNISSIDEGHLYKINAEIDPNSDEVNVIINTIGSINSWKENPEENITIGKDYEIDEDEDTDNNSSGTEENPYTINDAMDKMGEKNVWVIGYIVGHYTGTTVKTFSNNVHSLEPIKETCIALSMSQNEKDGENTFPVFLKTGDMRNTLNLNSNPDMIGKKVAIKGHIDKYYGSIGLNVTLVYKII